MDVYLTWSDNRGRLIAEILQDWLPQVMQAIEVSLTPGEGMECEVPARLERAEVRALLGHINSALGPAAMREARLDAAFEKWWPDLENLDIPPGELAIEKLRRAALTATVQAGFNCELRIRDIQGTFWVELIDEKGKRRAQTHTLDSVESKTVAVLTKKIFDWVSIIQAYERGERP